MLTREALRERQWGRFPALRQALEERNVPDEYYGLTSVSDSMFDRVRRSAEIAVLLRAHQTVVVATARSTGREMMCHDLTKLGDELRATADLFSKFADEVLAVRPMVMADHARLDPSPSGLDQVTWPYGTKSRQSGSRVRWYRVPFRAPG